MSIKIAILSVLTECGSYALSSPILKTEVQCRVGKIVSGTAFSNALAELNRDAHIRMRKDAGSNKLRWFKAAA